MATVYWVRIHKATGDFRGWDFGPAKPPDTAEFDYVQVTRRELGAWLDAEQEANPKGLITKRAVIRDNGDIRVVAAGKTFIRTVNTDPPTAQEVIDHQRASKATALPPDTAQVAYVEQSDAELQQYLDLQNQKLIERRPARHKVRWNTTTRIHTLDPDDRPYMKWTPTGDVSVLKQTGSIGFNIEKLTGPGGPVDTGYGQQDFPTNVDVVIPRLLALDFSAGLSSISFTSDISGIGSIRTNREMNVEYGGGWDGNLAFVEK